MSAELKCVLGGQGLTLATAESCTGGLVGAMITDVAGSLAYYLGGVVAYANEAKVKLLGVKPETLRRYGAVSAQTAIEMAKGVRRCLGADIGVATTGIAGPTGGSRKKPVGLVFIAVATGRKLGNRVVVRECRFQGGRKSNRTQAALAALEMVVEVANER